MTASLRRLGALTGVACLLATACTTIVDSPPPLSLSLEVDRTTALTGQEFEFTYDAEGGNLVGLALDFGDGAVDSIPLFGARTAAGFRSHTYGAPGTFMVTAVLTAPPQGSRTASVSVTVSDPPDQGS
jgi:hypothetical protein